MLGSNFKASPGPQPHSNCIWHPPWYSWNHFLIKVAPNTPQQSSFSLKKMNQSSHTCQ
ncbi:hypothetical protein C1H46_032295 [Malus baccata]|uniref:Uncharacterized protein n=1 Tax=Malus baccata TaxID=106549 RepID=A0A540L6T2_MALBA|nr:hypothetical protein C1H46_032295 [Malus baccata]